MPFRALIFVSIPLNLVCYFMWLHGMRVVFVHHRWKFNTFEIPKFNGHQIQMVISIDLCAWALSSMHLQKNAISYTYLEIDWHTKKCRNFFRCQFSALPLSDVTVAKHYSHLPFQVIQCGGKQVASYRKSKHALHTESIRATSTAWSHLVRQQHQMG